jgi:hypothetical protein
MGEVEIELRPDGTVVVHTEGVKGPQCLKYTEFLQQLIGRQKSLELTSEYYEKESQIQVQARQRQTLK